MKKKYIIIGDAIAINPSSLMIGFEKVYLTWQHLNWPTET
jgi:hypothetical protein